MGSFNRWASGSFLASPANRRVVQIARNLLEGAAVLTRAQLAVTDLDFTFFGLPAYGEDSSLVATLDATPAAILAAGLKGIDEGYELPPEATDNIYALTDAERLAEGITSLPGSLRDALDSMERSELVADQRLVASRRGHVYSACFRFRGRHNVPITPV